MSLRVGVAPGTTTVVVQPPNLGDFRCLNCAPGSNGYGPSPLQGPLVNGRLNVGMLGICPPDPVVQFLTPFAPAPPPSAASTPAGIHITGESPYATESLLKGASPLGVSWPVLFGVFGLALAGGGAIGWLTRRKRR